MSAEEERQWAVELKKAQQQTKRAATIPIGIRKAHIAEQMQYQKNLLEQAAYANDALAARDALSTLIQLRGEQTAVALKEMEELFGPVTEPALEAEMRQYYADCAALSAAVEARLAG